MRYGCHPLVFLRTTGGWQARRGPFGVQRSDMNISVIVGARSRLTVPRKLLSQLNLKPGGQLRIPIQSNGIVTVQAGRSSR